MRNRIKNEIETNFVFFNFWKFNSFSPFDYSNRWIIVLKTYRFYCDLQSFKFKTEQESY